MRRFQLKGYILQKTFRARSMFQKHRSLVSGEGHPGCIGQNRTRQTICCVEGQKVVRRVHKSTHTLITCVAMCLFFRGPTFFFPFSHAPPYGGSFAAVMNCPWAPRRAAGGQVKPRWGLHPQNATPPQNDTHRDCNTHFNIPYKASKARVRPGQPQTKSRVPKAHTVTVAKGRKLHTNHDALRLQFSCCPIVSPMTPV